MKNGNLEIEWMTGIYGEPWMTCHKKIAGKRVPWREKINQSTILFQLELARGHRLGSMLKNKLQQAYKQRTGV